MSLTPEQQTALRDALLAAYPTEKDLEMMLSDRLGHSLVQLVAPGPLRSQVFELIKVAVADGWDEDLVCFGHAEKPRSPKLRQFMQDHFPAHLLTPTPQAQVPAPTQGQAPSPTQASQPAPRSPLRLVYAGAPEDNKHLGRLARQLKVLEDSNHIRAWSEEQIRPGELREQAIQREWAAANLVVLLVSTDLFSSGAELVQRALQRLGAGGAVIPVLVRHVLWEFSALAKLSPLPSDRKPISTRPDPDEAWSEVAAAIAQEVARHKVATPNTPPQAPAVAPRASVDTAQVQVNEQAALKILFLSASPVDQMHLQVSREQREIRDRMRRAETRDSVTLIAEPHLQVSDLAGYLLQHRPHVLHFSGHGTNEAMLLMEDPAQAGKSIPVPVQAIEYLLKAVPDNLALVVLNACYSANKPEQAQALADAVGFCIGMEGTIGNQAAIQYAAGFYDGLTFGCTVRECLDLGVAALRLGGARDTPHLLCRAGLDPNTFRIGRNRGN